MASNVILAYAMEQGDKMALSGVRNSILGESCCCSSPGKVRGNGQQRKAEGGVHVQAGASPQALLGLVTHSSDLYLWGVGLLLV